MIHEDLLLSRIDILENKLSCYQNQKNITNEKLQEQINQLQDEKEVYQVSNRSVCVYSYNISLNSLLTFICVYFFFSRKPQKKP